MYKFKQETHCLGNVPSILPSPFQVSYEAWRLLPLAFKRLARILVLELLNDHESAPLGYGFPRVFSRTSLCRLRGNSFPPARTHARTQNSRRGQLSACACADRASGAVHGVDQINETPEQPGSALTCTYGPPFTIFTECFWFTCCESYLRVCAPSLTSIFQSNQLTDYVIQNKLLYGRV